MKIYEGTKEIQLKENSAVAIGKFDGFHVGHQTLLKEVMKKKQEGFEVVIFTFAPSPGSFFSKEPIKELTTKEEKRQLFRQAGVDTLIEYPFDIETAKMDPIFFIKEILVEKLNAKWIVAGDDVTFGYKGAGDAKLLQEQSGRYHYQVQIIEKVKLFGHEISSTYVRDMIRIGDMKKATALLGSPFHIAGIVAPGKQLGRTIGMPTANLYPEDTKLLPPFGVYYSKICIDGKSYRGITNIGMKPTVTDEKQIGVETFLYDFKKDIYGKEIIVSLLEYKRPEQKFESLEALKNQMEKDIDEGSKYQ